jgi:CDP-diacylglycerol--glycerol-3-phosphate 3-phosphatidyltransferase
VVLIILGALFYRWGVMAPVLWVLAVLSTVTVIHRISYTYQRTKAQRTKTSGASPVLAPNLDQPSAAVLRSQPQSPGDLRPAPHV